MGLVSILANSSLAAETAPHIVRLRAGVDVDAVVKELHLKPSHVYRHALHGFAAALDAAAIEQLKQHRHVLTVAARQTACIVTLKPETCATMIPAATRPKGL